MKTKRCNQCGIEYPANTQFFCRRKERPTGLGSWCKECKRKYDKKYRKENSDRIQKYEESRKERKAKYIENYKKGLMEKSNSGMSYKSIHNWIRKYKSKPLYCLICNEVKLLELANISGKYKKDIADFMYLCHECHSLYDHLKGGIIK